MGESIGQEPDGFDWSLVGDRQLPTATELPDGTTNPLFVLANKLGPEVIGSLDFE